MNGSSPPSLSHQDAKRRLRERLQSMRQQRRRKPPKQKSDQSQKSSKKQSVDMQEFLASVGITDSDVMSALQEEMVNGNISNLQQVCAFLAPHLAPEMLQQIARDYGDARQPS